MLAIYTHPNRFIRNEAGESVPSFTPFQAGSSWFIRMSRADRRLMTVDDYVQQVSRMTDRQLIQSCRNRGLDDSGTPDELRERLTACCYPEEDKSSEDQQEVDEPYGDQQEAGEPEDPNQTPEADKLNFRDLQKKLKGMGLSAAGTYDELVERLESAQAAVEESDEA